MICLGEMRLLPPTRRALLLGAGSALLLPRLAGAAPRQDGRIRGVTVSTPTWGWEWGTAAMGQALDELMELGVNWVAIHPYASIEGDGTVRPPPVDPRRPPDWLRVPVEEAHARGLKLLVVPHLAYWGSPFSWRGAITFSDEATWRRFFDGYGRFLTTLAEATRGADALCIGSELEGTVHREAEWRALVGEVRSRFPGPICYGANWSEIERVRFWDLVDAIGVQAYFPLVAPGQAPELATLEASWVRILEQMRTLSQRWNKPIVFTELGYPRSAEAALEPWRHEDDASAGALQERCLDVALRALEREPTVVGAFLWKWFPGPSSPEDFAMDRAELRATIRARWGGREVYSVY